MIDTDKHEGVRTPFGIVPTEDILKMLEPIRERDNKIAELDAEVKRLRFLLKDVVDELATHLGDYEDEMYDWIRKVHKWMEVIE